MRSRGGEAAGRPGQVSWLSSIHLTRGQLGLLFAFHISLNFQHLLDEERSGGTWRDQNGEGTRTAGDTAAG